MKTSFLLIILLTNFGIIACAPVANKKTTLTAQDLAQDRRTREIILSDQAIESEAYSELDSENKIKKLCHININAYNGATLITGEAPTEELKAKIISLVQVIDNVKMVHDNIKIAKPSSPESQSND